MSRSFSVTANFAADRPCTPQGIGLLVRLRTLLADVRRRRKERAMAMAVERLGHPGVIADYQRATLDSCPLTAKRSGFAGQRVLYPGHHNR